MTVYFVSLDMDCCRRSRWTMIFTCTAADTFLLIDGRYSRRVLIIRIDVYIFDCMCRTFACTVETFYSVCDHYAKLRIHHGMAYLNR